VRKRIEVRGRLARLAWDRLGLRHLSSWQEIWGEFPVAPPPPVGSSVAPPEFVGVGTQKAGTSWWSTMIFEHPEVSHYPGFPKERHFFDNALTWFDGSRAFVDEYARWFPRRSGQIAGEWTPRYVCDELTMSLLSEAAPRARVLVIFRNPISRLRSGLTHILTRGHMELHWAISEQLSRNDYAQQLRRAYRHFPAEQVLVLQFERLVADPRTHIRRTFEHLGIDSTFVPPSISRPVNRSGTSVPLPAPAAQEILAREYRRQVAELASMTDQIDPSLWEYPVS
jgi:hypothetical protein